MGCHLNSKIYAYCKFYSICGNLKWLKICFLILNLLTLIIIIQFVGIFPDFNSNFLKFIQLKKNQTSSCKFSKIFEQNESLYETTFCHFYSHISNLFNRSATIEDSGISEQYTKPDWIIQPANCLCRETLPIAVIGIVCNWGEIERRNQVLNFNSTKWILFIFKIL